MKTGPRERGPANTHRLVDVVQRVIDVELARWRNKVRVLDHCLEFARLVVDDDDGAFLVLAGPDREPNFITGLVELTLNDAFRAFTQLRPFTNRQRDEAGVEAIDIENGHGLTDRFVRVQWRVNPQIGRFRVRLDE